MHHDTFVTIRSSRLTSPCSNHRLPCKVIGGGSFGLAMAVILAKKGIATTLLVRDEATANSVIFFAYLFNIEDNSLLFIVTDKYTSSSPCVMFFAYQKWT